jgi:hypothetical protein
MTNKAFFKQVGGKHYKTMKIQPSVLLMKIIYHLQKVMQLSIYADINLKEKKKIY